MEKGRCIVARAEIQRTSMDNTHIRNLHNNIMQAPESAQTQSITVPRSEASNYPSASHESVWDLQT